MFLCVGTCLYMSESGRVFTYVSLGVFMFMTLDAF